jgi:hypothetical protein
MRACSVAALLALTLLPAGVLRAAAVENAALRLEVSDENGSIVSLYDKRNRTEYVANRGLARLFELLIPDATNYSRRIVSWKQRAASVRLSGGQIEIRFASLKPDEEQYSFGSGLVHVPQPVLDIEATASLRLVDDHIEATLRLVNRSYVTLTGVAFPYVGGLPLQSGETRAAVVLPSVSQRVYTSTLGALSGQKALRYPAMIASSWLNYEFPARSVAAVKGIGIEVRSGLEAQDAWFSLSPGPFRPGSAYRGRYEYPFIAWIHYPHLAGGGEWTTPPARLHVHAADWHTIAAEHREWYRAAVHPKAARVRRAGLGFATYRLKGDDNTIRWKYTDLPSLASAAATAGIDRVVVDGWRRQEGPSNPAPFGEIADDRLGGAAELRATIDALRRGGTELLFTFHPTLLNVTQGRVPPEIEIWGVKTRRQGNQLPVDFLFHTSDYPEALDYASYRVEIDPASAATDELVRVAKRLQTDYGFHNLLLKGVGQQAFLSYNRKHGVAPQAVYAAGFARLLRELRETYAGGLLLTEGFNDLVNPLADGGYTWDQSRDAPVLAYSLPWGAFSNDVEALDYAAANLAFVYGMAINLVVDGGHGTVGDYPRFARHLRSLAALRTTTAAYLSEAEFRDHEGLRDVRHDDGVLTAVYTNGRQARSALVVANLNDRVAAARCTIATLTGAASVRGIARHDATIDLGRPIELSLAPYEVLVIAIDSAPGR